jgi:hypothetical protein
MSMMLIISSDKLQRLSKSGSTWPASDEQCEGYPYAYPQHMNVLKHFLYIQYGCGEEVSGILQPQPCQHVIISPPPSPDYPNLGQLGQQCNSARVHPYAYPQHMNVLKHFLCIQYGCGEEVSGSCTASTMSTHHYFIPPSPDYPNLGQLRPAV